MRGFHEFEPEMWLFIGIVHTCGILDTPGKNKDTWGFAEAFLITAIKCEEVFKLAESLGICFSKGLFCLSGVIIKVHFPTPAQEV